MPPLLGARFGHRPTARERRRSDTPQGGHAVEKSARGPADFSGLNHTHGASEAEEVAGRSTARISSSLDVGWLGNLMTACHPLAWGRVRPASPGRVSRRLGRGRRGPFGRRTWDLNRKRWQTASLRPGIHDRLRLRLLQVRQETPGPWRRAWACWLTTRS
jgi:hypothetical protein